MKRLTIIMIFLFALFDMGLSGCFDTGLAYASDAKSIAAELKKFNPMEDEKLPNAYRVIDLACHELMKKEGRDKPLLLDEIILLYSRIIPVHLTHHAYEYLMPYYKKNPKLVKKAVARLLSKKNAKEFFHRLNLIIRENTEGQD